MNEQLSMMLTMFVIFSGFMCPMAYLFGYAAGGGYMHEDEVL